MSKRRCFIRIGLLTAGLVGCSKLAPEKRGLDAALFSQGESALNPSTDRLTDACFGSPDFDACIYQKNPVAQERATVSLQQAALKRRFGVKIRGLWPTGYLENQSVQVYTLSGPRFYLRDLAVLKELGSEEALAQISAYYWSNRLFDYLNARLGVERVPLKGLKIYPDDAFSGYVSATNSVHLEKKDDRMPKAYSGEVIINLTAQALAQKLSGDKLFTKDSTQHNLCALDPKGCCASASGCAQSLGNGFGEYVAAMMFPESARTGESIANAVVGQKICGVARDLNTLVTRPRAQVYSACAPEGRAVLMGAWYASVWWKLRRELEAQGAGASVDVDKLFFDHARAWTATSTFTEAKTEALRLAGQYKSGKYLNAFAAAFVAAGI